MFPGHLHRLRMYISGIKGRARAHAGEVTPTEEVVSNKGTSSAEETTVDATSTSFDSDLYSNGSKEKKQKSAIPEKQKLLELAVSLTGKSATAIGELIVSKEDINERAARLAIKDGSSITFVPVKDIDWIDAAGDYMCVHAKNETHIMRTTMKELEAKLDPSIFQRVHRSTIVNTGRVEKVSSHINGEFHLTLSCGSSLKMSRSYKGKVKHFF